MHTYVCPSRKSRRGFTFVELLVVLAVSLFLFTLVLRAAGNANEEDNRKKCASNLAQIGQAMVLYSNDNNGQFPRGSYDREHADKVNCYTAAAIPDPFAKEGPVNDVTAAIFMLLRTQEITPELFICPSSGKSALKYADGKTAQSFSNFPNNESLSFSMHNPFAGAVGVNAGARWNNTLAAEFILAGDMNPGGDALAKLTGTSPREELKKGNSRNHLQDGQNILFGDGHVDFTRTPFCGMDHDNAFTYGPSGNDAGGTGVSGPPASASDSVLLPTAEDGTPGKK